MNRNVIKYFPLLLYTFLLFMVWIGSWVAGVASLFRGSDVDFVLASADGVRWFVRSSVDGISALPWGELLLLLMTSGIFVASGLPVALSRALQRKATLKMRRALWVALITLLLLSLLLIACNLYPLSLSKSISGTLVGSPMAEGALFILFLLVFLLSVPFGIVYGTFRGVGDVVDALCCRVQHHASSFVALLPVALLMSSVGYADVGISDAAFVYIKYSLILFPFLYALAVRH